MYRAAVLVLFLAGLSSVEGLRLEPANPKEEKEEETAGPSRQLVFQAGEALAVTDEEQGLMWKTKGIPDNCTFLTAEGTPANCKIERPEQELVRRHFLGNETVLELGGRYGSTTCEIAAKLGNSGRQVVVEPDSTVWAALESNLAAHRCNANVHKGIVGKAADEVDPARGTSGYGKRGPQFVANRRGNEPKVEAMSWQGVEERFGLKFDTLLIDCEGCGPAFVDQNPGLLDQVHTILMEGDMGEYKGEKAPDCGSQCVNYDHFIAQLESEGFTLVDTLKETKGRHDDRNHWIADCCTWVSHFVLKRTTTAAQ